MVKDIESKHMVPSIISFTIKITYRSCATNGSSQLLAPLNLLAKTHFYAVISTQNPDFDLKSLSLVAQIRQGAIHNLHEQE